MSDGSRQPVGSDELRSGGTILGAPANHLVTFALACGLMAIGISVVLGATLAVIGLPTLLLMHRRDPDALDIWRARLRPPWCNGWIVGAKRRPFLWTD